MTYDDIEALRYNLDNNTKWNLFVKRKELATKKRAERKEAAKDIAKGIAISAVLLNDWEYTIDKALKFFGM